MHTYVLLFFLDAGGATLFRGAAFGCAPGWYLQVGLLEGMEPQAVFRSAHQLLLQSELKKLEFKELELLQLLLIPLQLLFLSRVCRLLQLVLSAYLSGPSFSIGPR